MFLSIWPGLAAAQGRITQAVLGTGVTDKFEIVNATSEFSPNTPKIYCAWKAEGVKGGTPVRGVWIAEDVDTAAPKNYKIDEAAYSGDNDMAELLLAEGAAVNAKAKDGDTPLHMAAGKDYKDVAELLLANKADVDAKDNDGWTPLALAAANGYKDVAELLRQHGGHE